MADLPLLYSFRRCPFAIRARLALIISETPVTLHEVNLARKPAAMIAASPKSTVPVLILPDGTIIDESLAIMRWALARHDPENWLASAGEARIATNDGPFKQHLDAWKYRRDATARDAAMAFIVALPVPAPRSLTLMAILPFVRQFAAADPAWFAAQPVPHVHDWLAQELASPLFTQAMAKAPPAAGA
nr:glutathione S-transferase N-terminal domain-containing protein [Polymorphobacter sp.]